MIAEYALAAIVTHWCPVRWKCAPYDCRWAALKPPLGALYVYVDSTHTDPKCVIVLPGAAVVPSTLKEMNVTHAW